MRVETEICDVKTAVRRAGRLRECPQESFHCIRSNTYLTYRHLTLQVSFVCLFLLYRKFTEIIEHLFPSDLLGGTKMFKFH